VRISVKDTGIGIAPEDHARVFDEFTQLDHPLQRKLRGTGLGLPLCRRLADLLGGRVELESELGVGSTFSLILPLVYSPGDARAVQPSSDDRPFTVLHVEDVELDRYLVQNLLRYDRALRLLHAEDGLAAIEMARSERPDLVILDLNLPRLSGAEVLENLSADPATASIPVAVLTGAHLEGEGGSPSILRHAIAVLSKDSLADSSGLLIERGPPLRISLKKVGGGE
jgi:CheY-like chemotaxis protein